MSDSLEGKRDSKRRGDFQRQRAENLEPKGERRWIGHRRRYGCVSQPGFGARRLRRFTVGMLSATKQTERDGAPGVICSPPEWPYSGLESV